MSLEEHAIVVKTDIGIQIQRKDAKNVCVMLMEVNIIYVTFVLVNVFVKMGLKVQNVINVKMAIMDSLQVDAKVSLNL